MNNKFKVGDRVVSLFHGDEGKNKQGTLIKKSKKYPDSCWIIKWDDGINGSCGEEGYSSYAEVFLELVKKNNSYIYFTGFDSLSKYQNDSDRVTLTINKQTIMSKITNYVKNLTLSADEKLLRKFNLHNECGENTMEAKEVIDEKNYNTTENQAYLIEVAKGLELEEKNQQ